MPLNARQSIGSCRALTLLTVLLAALAPAARAQSVNNSASRPGVAVYGTPRIINVGILRLSSAGQNTVMSTTYPLSSTVVTDQFRGAYLFYILNNRPDILPSIWTLKNPNAPTRVDATISARFPTAYAGYVQDTPVTQNMAPYWEINGDTVNTVLGLSAYDLIVITTSGRIALNLDQRRALRQFVDKGGTLWIDTAPGATLDPSLIFHAELGTTFPAGGTSTNDLSHPLATGYYTLANSDLDNLGLTKVGGSRQILSDVLGNMGNTPDPSLFHAVNTFPATGNSNFGSIAAADYGNGHILITDRAICDDINDNVGTKNTGTVTDLNGYGVSGTNFLAAPAADLKFVVNVLAWASNADGPGGGGRFDNAQPGAVSGAIQSNWTYKIANGGAASQPIPAGTATYGNRMFLTTTDGYLLAFDINPGESLTYGADMAVGGDDYIGPTPGADPFTGIHFNVDYSNGYPYDEIWGLHVADAISAPTVAEIPIVPTGGGAAVNTPEVLVETDTGAVSAYNAVNGARDFTVNGTMGFPGAGGVPPVIPAPTYYRGRIFATQHDRTIAVSTPGTGAAQYSIQVQMSTTGTPPVMSSVAVQSIPQSSMAGNNGEDVMGYVYETGGSSMYALDLGARDEHLQYLSYTGATNASTYETQEQMIPGFAGLLAYGAPEDTDDVLSGLAWLFDFPTAGSDIAVVQSLSLPPPLPVPINMINNVAPPTDMYADFDLEPPTGSAVSMTRTTIISDLLGATTGQHGAIQGIAVSSVSQGIAASLSNESTAFNTANNVYVTVNEPSNVNPSTGYIMSVKERTPVNAKSFIAWRFALVNGATDAEGVTYNFGGYHFVGAPVSDGNGYVYALATNAAGTSTRLMAFFANAVCGFVAPFTATSVTQTDELGNVETINPTQYSNNTFTNFSASGMTVLQPDLCIPLPLTVAGSSQNGNAVPDVSVPVSTAQGAEPLLAWWIELPATVPGVIAANAPTVVPTSPLRKIGNTLYFGGQETTVSGTPAVTGTDYALFAVNSDPFGIGIQADPTTRQITSTDYRLVQVTPSSVGPISLPPAGTGKYLVTAAAPYTQVGAGVQTPGGVEGFGYVPTLVADNHRLVELDPSGNATWVVDSTREPTTQAGGGASPQVSLKTTVPLNRPTSLTQFSTDDYLLADTGNNRVVHIGRIGDVLTEFPDKYGHTLLATTRPQTGPPAVAAIPHALEITGFSDPGGILAPGAPTTLNQPSNVTFWMTYDQDPSITPLVTAPTVIVAHYLICDTGNNRIVEVDDTYTLNQATGLYDFAQNQDYHQLVWVSKTTENGHRYKYVAAQGLFPPATASYDPLTDGPQAILAAVSNARVASLALPAGGPPMLSPANQDAQGSAVLALTYEPLSGAMPTPYTTHPTDGLPFVAINTVQADGPTAAGTTPAKTYPLRGLRSIQAYGYVAPAGTTVTGTQFGLVIADDDGVFDGVFNAASTTVAGNVLDATTNDGGWSFRAVDPNATGGDYAAIVTQYDAILDTKNDQPLTGTVSATDYVGTPFSPASALRLANNSYLIVNQGGSGNPNGVPAFPATGETGTDFGGNVFVVRATTAASGKRTDGGTLSGVIFGKPANTGALDGPSFALKSN